MRYGKVLDYYINEVGISRAELARRIGVSRGQITELINGETKEPGLTRAKNIADALGVPLNDMLDMMFKDSGEAK